MQRIDFFSRYNGVYHLLARGYADKFMLQTLDNLKISNTNYNPMAFSVLGHICELIKADLALAIWKVFIDNDSDSTTIRHLNTLLRQSGISTSTKLSLTNPNVEEKINTIRNEILAHNDFSLSGVSVQMPDLYLALDEIRTMYNELCKVSPDDRVAPLTDQDINSISITSKFGFGLLVGGHAKIAERGSDNE